MKRILKLLPGLALVLVLAGSAWAGQPQYKDRPAKRAKVEIYTTAWCPYCRKTEAFFRANGIDFINYDIEKDKAAARRMAQLDSRKGVPLVVINGQVIHGYSEHLFRTALGLDD